MDPQPPMTWSYGYVKFGDIILYYIISYIDIYTQRTPESPANRTVWIIALSLYPNGRIMEWIETTPGMHWPIQGPQTSETSLGLARGWVWGGAGGCLVLSVWHRSQAGLV